MEKKNIMSFQKVRVNDVDMYWILSTHDEFLVPCQIITRTTRFRNLSAYRLGSALSRYLCTRPVAEISKNAQSP